jgi:hypothetical protein
MIFVASRIAHSYVLGYQLIVFGDRLRTERRRLLIIAPSTVVCVDRTKCNGRWHACQGDRFTSPAGLASIATGEGVMVMGSAIGAVDIGGAGASVRIMASMPGSSSGRDATKAYRATASL